MNVSDFITKLDFDELMKSFESHEAVDKQIQHKENGNVYTLHLSLRFNTYSKEFWFTSYLNYNYYNDTYKHRSVGGGTLTLNDVFNWEEFKNRLDDRLRQFPDYSSQEQLTLF